MRGAGFPLRGRDAGSREVGKCLWANFRLLLVGPDLRQHVAISLTPQSQRNGLALRANPFPEVGKIDP